MFGDCPYHDCVGHYGYSDSEVFGTNPCWWGNDGMGGLHCEGWDAGLFMGYQWYWDLGSDPATTGYGRFTLEQAKNNSCPRVAPFNSYSQGQTGLPPETTADWRTPQFLGYGIGYGGGAGAYAPADSGTTRGPDGLMLGFGIFSADIAANVSGEARNFSWPQVIAQYNGSTHVPSWWNFTRTGGWLEMVEWETGTHFLYDHQVP
jgi:hypothetical protein